MVDDHFRLQTTDHKQIHEISHSQIRHSVFLFQLGSNCTLPELMHGLQKQQDTIYHRVSALKWLQVPTYLHQC